MKRIGVDVGGTFTDLFFIDEETGSVYINKVPSTPADPSQAILTGVKEICAQAGVRPEEITRFYHGTTIATNTVLEHKGAKVGMITTEGFRDILHIARKKRPFNFSLYFDVPWQSRPLIKRRYRLTVAERIDARGRVLIPLDEMGVREAARKLKRAGVEAVVVAFLNSFINPIHEERAKEIVLEEFPEAYICTSSEVLSQYREYERFNTAAVNAYVGPKVSRYILSLDRALKEYGIRSDIHLMQSSGGTATVDAAIRKPVTLLLSGPAAGLIGGTKIANHAGYKSVITLDIGGTSADIGVAPNGEIRMKHLLDSKVGDYSIMVPIVDMDTIGAGGGSIAYVDDGGMFRVGPQSAGSDPGPACYGRGGQEATITDCNLVLGRIRPNSLLGGNFHLDASLAEAVIQEKLAYKLGLSLEEAALGALRIMVNNMVRAIELNSVRRGYDPRDFVLVAFGGAGPMFACDIAMEMDIPTVLIPPHPGITSAVGLLTTDLSYEYVRTIFKPIQEMDHQRLQNIFEELEAEALTQLKDDGASEDAILLARYADCRYVGQGYELRIPVSSGDINDAWVEKTLNDFHEAHERQYFHRFEAPVELINVRVVGIAKEPDVQWQTIPEGDADASQALIGTADVWFWENDQPSRHATRIYRREKLLANNVIPGPAIIEQFDSTTVIPPAMIASIDRWGNIIITRQQA